jgi:hypothetical protein
MSSPVLEGVPLATAAEMEALQKEVADLRRRMAELERPGLSPELKQAIGTLQASYEAMSEEERQGLAEAEAEARSYFGRGPAGG